MRHRLPGPGDAGGDHAEGPQVDAFTRPESSNVGQFVGIVGHQQQVGSGDLLAVRAGELKVEWLSLGTQQVGQHVGRPARNVACGKYLQPFCRRSLAHTFGQNAV